MKNILRLTGLHWTLLRKEGNIGTVAFTGGSFFAWDVMENEAAVLDIDVSLSEGARKRTHISPITSLEKKKKLIEERMREVEEAYRSCTLCPEECWVNKLTGGGPCAVSPHPSYFRADVLVSEEQVLSRPYAIFFQGCNLRCVFCHAQPEAFSQSMGYPYFPKEMAKRMDASGAETLLFTGGEPLMNLKAILETMLNLQKDVPVVLSTNLYTGRKALDLLMGIADVYLIDLKAHRYCSHMLTGKGNFYFDIVTRNIRYLRRIQPEATLIIRHLLLPGHFKCCTKRIFWWIKHDVPEILLRPIYGYHPWYWASSFIKTLNRVLRVEEIEQASALAKGLGLNVIE